MKIIIETIDHKKQRYPTVGDWIVEADGTRHIYVSDMGNDDYAFLVGLHEMIEQRLCEKRGITQESVDSFDKKFEGDRAKGKHGEDDEPGDDPKAPYRREHFFATNIEALMCDQLGVNFQVYEAAVYSLP
jgi:hypothetical protein